MNLIKYTIFSAFLLATSFFTNIGVYASACTEVEKSFKAQNPAKDNLTAAILELWVNKGKVSHPVDFQARLGFLALDGQTFQLRQQMNALTKVQKNSIDTEVWKYLDARARMRPLDDFPPLPEKFLFPQAIERVRQNDLRRASVLLSSLLNNKRAMQGISGTYLSILQSIYALTLETEEYNLVRKKILQGKIGKIMADCFHLQPDLPVTVKTVKPLLKEMSSTMEAARATSGIFESGSAENKIRVDFYYSENLASHSIYSGDSWILGSDQEGVFWPLNEREIMRTPAGVLALDTIPVHLNVSFNFGTSGEGNRFNFRFDISEKRNEKPEIHTLLSQINAIPLTISKTQNKITIYPYFSSTPFPDSSLEIEQSQNSPASIVIRTNQSKSSISFRELRFNMQAKPSVEKLIKGKKVLKTETGFTRPVYETASLRRFLVNSDTASENSSGQIFQELQADLRSARFPNPAFYQKLAEKYHSRLNNEALDFHFDVARLYSLAYNHNKAVQVLEEAFALSESRDEKGEIKRGFSMVSDPDREYINALVMTGDYRNALDFIDFKLRKAQKVYDVNETYLMGIQKADILTRASRPQEALETLTSIRLRFSHPGNLSLTLSAMEVQLASYLMKNKEAAAAFTYWENKRRILSKGDDNFLAMQKESLQRASAAESNPVRLKHPPVLPGQGKNFCAPIALEFALRVLGDQKVTQKEIADSMGTNDAGTNFSNILSYLKERNVQTSAAVLNIEQAADLLKRGLPILTLLWPPDSSIGHISVLLGVDVQKKVYYFYEPGLAFSMLAIHESELKKSQMIAGSVFLIVGNNNREVKAHKSAEEVLKYLDIYTSGADAQALLTSLDEIAAHDKKEGLTEFLLFHRLNALLRLSTQSKLTQLQMNYIKSILSQWELSIPTGLSYLTYRSFGDLALHAGKVELADKVFTTGLQDNPTDFLSLIRSADLSLRKGDSDTAFTLAGRALRDSASLGLYPGLFEQIIVRSAQVKLEKKDVRGAVEALMTITDFSTLTPQSRQLIKIMQENKMQNSIRFLQDIAGFKIDKA
ncbi:MAG: hypothetical protein KDK41_02770 [Leptospiraceae bacterium]|nr:hypothetical protein [Leptospiraceae bacterium]